MKVCIGTEYRFSLIVKDGKTPVKSTLAVVLFHTTARRMGEEREHVCVWMYATYVIIFNYL